MNRSQLPKELKEFYLQHKKQHPDTASILIGFAVLYKKPGSASLEIRTQYDWQAFVEEPETKEYLTIEPLIHYSSIVGNALLSAIYDQKTTLVHRLLDMGLDPMKKSPQGGENALHWSVSGGDLSIIQRLVIDFKMSLTERNGLGSSCLTGLSYSKISQEMLKWFYSLPNCQEIMEANRDTVFFSTMTDFVNETKKKEIQDIRSSILSLRVPDCTSLQFFAHVFKILDEEKETQKDMLKTVMTSALIFSQDDVLRSWLKEHCF